MNDLIEKLKNFARQIGAFLFGTEPTRSYGEWKASSSEWDSLISSTESDITISSSDLKRLIDSADRMFDLIIAVQLDKPTRDYYFTEVSVAYIDRLTTAASNYLKERWK